MDYKFVNIQEGMIVDEQVIKLFDLTFKDINSSGKSRFTGLIVKDKNVLISWPKHFHKERDLENATLDQAKLLFDILVKYMKQIESDLSDNQLLNIKEMFPIEAFQSILDYYNKYGLYSEEVTVEKQGYLGKVDWKSTINKSNKVISNNQLLFIPFFLKNKLSENVFLSECMAYVINETYNMLAFLFPNRIHIDLSYNNQLFLDKGYVLQKLYSLKGTIFKDINKKLLSDLIQYFELRGNPKELKYKNYYFNLIWEKMIEEYLNRNLKSITRTSLEFESNYNTFSFHKQSFDRGGWEIIADHYQENDNFIYLLDSKYFQNLRDLNYKQVAYDYFLKKENKQIINALIICGNKDKTETHIDYKKDDLFITSHYLSIQKVMRDCANQ